LFLLHKNLPRNRRGWIIFLRLMLDGLAGIKLLLEGKPKHTLAIIKAHFKFYSGIGQNKHKRQNISQHNLTGMLSKNILIASFIKKQHTFKQIIEN